MKKYIAILLAIILILLIIISIGIALQMVPSNSFSIYVNMVDKTVYIEDLKTKKHKEYKITEEKVDAIKTMLENYQELIEKDIDKYYPEEETEELEIKWQLSYVAEEKDEMNSYRYGGILQYPENWEQWVKELKKIVE